MWVAGGQWLIRLMGVLNVAVLARLLSPTDFGFIAVAMSIVAILELASDYGNESFLIRTREKNDDDYATVWTLNILRNLLIGGLIIIFAKPLATAFEDPRYFQVFIWLGAIVSFSGIKSIYVVDFQKDLQFDKDVLLAASAQFVAITCSIAAAYLLRSYWALIIGYGGRQCATVVFSYLMIRRRSKLSLKSFSRVFSFSIWLMIANAIAAIASRMDAILLQRFMPMAAIGVYTVGRQLARMAVVDLIGPLGKVLFPAISQGGHNKDVQRHYFYRSISVLLLIALPASIGLAITAPELTRVFLGDQWAEAATVMAIAAVSGPILILAPNLKISIMIDGNTKLSLYRALAILLFRTSGLIVGAWTGGYIGAAIGVAIASVAMMFVDLALLKYLIRPRYRHLAASCWRVMVASILMGIICFSLSYSLGPALGFWQALEKLVLIVVTGAVSYGLLLLGLWYGSKKPDGPESFVISFIEETGIVSRVLLLVKRP